MTIDPLAPTAHSAPEVPHRGIRRVDPRVALLLVFIAGALAFLPALRSPFILDDYMHTAMIEGTFPGKRGPFDLYDFVNPADRQVFFERGLLPWWAHPKLTIRFFRPLSSALRWLEQSAFGTHPLLFHVHSLAWWAVAVIAARALYRRAFTPRVALLATAIFALGQWHALPLAWLANREVLVSFTFGTFGLAAYARWRERARALDFAVATGLFSLAMLSGEYALCFGGYIVGLESVRLRDRLSRRAVGLVPFAVPTLAYLLVRAKLGYGTYGSAFYVDPIAEPVDFLRAAPERLVRLLGHEWLTLGTNAWGTSTPKGLVTALVVAGFALAFAPIRRALAAQTNEARATAVWLLVGSLVSLVPVLAVQPAPRLLAISAMGMAPSVALLLDHAWFGPRTPQRRANELTGFVATVLGFAHLIHGPVGSFIASEDLRRSAADYRATSASLAARLPDVPRAEIVIVRGTTGIFFGPFTLDPRGVLPARWRALAQTGHVLLLRKDARTIELVAPEDHGLFPDGPGNLFRRTDLPTVAGDTFDLPGVKVTVLQTGDHGPRRAQFEFESDPEAPPLTFIQEAYDGFREVELPKPSFGRPLDP